MEADSEPSASINPRDSPSPGASSTWTECLQKVGTYFEGIIADADTLLLEHTNATVTTYGTRTSRKIQVRVQLYTCHRAIKFLYTEY